MREFRDLSNEPARATRRYGRSAARDIHRRRATTIEAITAGQAIRAQRLARAHNLEEGDILVAHVKGASESKTKRKMPRAGVKERRVQPKHQKRGSAKTKNEPGER